MRLLAALLFMAGNAGAQETVTFYTSLHESNLPVLMAAFEKKHNVKVKLWRSGADKVLQRTVTEAGAGRFDVDAVFVGSGELEALHREKLLQPVKSAYHQHLIPGTMPAHGEWAPAYLTVWIQEYNTNAVRKDALPKTYQDLRDPRWKGKLGIEAANDDWFGQLVTAMGEQKGVELFRSIVATNGISARKGHSLLGNLVVSGEVPFAITMHYNVAQSAKKSGAPVDWIALEPLVARANGIGVMKKAPHPRAAQALYEFFISDEGQKLLAERDYVPVSTAVASPFKDAKLAIIEPGAALDQSEKWAKLFNDVVVQRRP
ncbi:MAG TPA: extracellular solute-binding protein [Burkholderiales bacterium]|nr:extracellular solute-binding protein [Burkholderiales bacterium]